MIVMKGPNVHIERGVDAWVWRVLTHFLNKGCTLGKQPQGQGRDSKGSKRGLGLGVALNLESQVWHLTHWTSPI